MKRKIVIIAIAVASVVGIAAGSTAVVSSGGTNGTSATWYHG